MRIDHTSTWSAPAPSIHWTSNGACPQFDAYAMGASHPLRAIAMEEGFRPLYGLLQSGAPVWNCGPYRGVVVKGGGQPVICLTVPDCQDPLTRDDWERVFFVYLRLCQGGDPRRFVGSLFNYTARKYESRPIRVNGAAPLSLRQCTHRYWQCLVRKHLAAVGRDVRCAPSYVQAYDLLTYPQAMAHYREEGYARVLHDVQQQGVLPADDLFAVVAVQKRVALSGPLESWAAGEVCGRLDRRDAAYVIDVRTPLDGKALSRRTLEWMFFVYIQLRCGGDPTGFSTGRMRRTTPWGEQLFVCLNGGLPEVLSVYFRRYCVMVAAEQSGRSGPLTYDEAVRVISVVHVFRAYRETIYPQLMRAVADLGAAPATALMSELTEASVQAYEATRRDRKIRDERRHALRDDRWAVCAMQLESSGMDDEMARRELASYLADQETASVEPTASEIARLRSTAAAIAKAWRDGSEAGSLRLVTLLLGERHRELLPSDTPWSDAQRRALVQIAHDIRAGEMDIMDIADAVRTVFPPPPLT